VKKKETKKKEVMQLSTIELGGAELKEERTSKKKG